MQYRSQSKNRHLLSVELKNLGKQAKPAARFLTNNLDESATLHGSRIELKQTNAKTVKQILHKFLHQEGLEDHRVILKPELVEILPPKKPKKHFEPERSTAGFNQT